MKDIIYNDEEQRVRQLANYFRFGQNGYQRMQDVSRHLENILQAYGQSSTYGTKIIRESMEHEFKGIRSEILAEYFGKLTNAGKLFELALKFENDGYSCQLQPPKALNPDQLSIIGILCDFHNIKREKVL
jgi:hypothetical protein